MNELPAVFDTSHYASSPGRKLARALELGPKYYLLDLPRYLMHRRRLGLPTADWAALVGPLREFRPSPPPGPLPPGYAAGLARFRELGIILTIPRGRLEALLAVWWATRDVPGDDIECGSYRGATSLLLAWLAARNTLDRRILLLDTFAGMPAPSAFDPARQAGEFLPPDGQVALIRQQAEALGVADRTCVYAGLFTDTFAAIEPSRPRFAFVHVDANIYAGTRDACRYCLPRTNPGGAVVFDDYHGPCDLGARLAIDESIADIGQKPIPLCASSAYLRIQAEEVP